MRCLLQTGYKSSSLNSVGLDVCSTLAAGVVFGAAFIGWSLISLY